MVTFANTPQVRTYNNQDSVIPGGGVNFPDDGAIPGGGVPDTGGGLPDTGGGVLPDVGVLDGAGTLIGRLAGPAVTDLSQAAGDGVGAGITPHMEAIGAEAAAGAVGGFEAGGGVALAGDMAAAAGNSLAPLAFGVGMQGALGALIPAVPAVTIASIFAGRHLANFSIDKVFNNIQRLTTDARRFINTAAFAIGEDGRLDPTRIRALAELPRGEMMRAVGCSPRRGFTLRQRFRFFRENIRAFFLKNILRKTDAEINRPMLALYQQNMRFNKEADQHDATITMQSAQKLFAYMADKTTETVVDSIANTITKENVLQSISTVTSRVASAGVASAMNELNQQRTQNNLVGAANTMTGAVIQQGARTAADPATLNNLGEVTQSVLTRAAGTISNERRVEDISRAVRGIAFGVSPAIVSGFSAAKWVFDASDLMGSYLSGESMAPAVGALIVSTPLLLAAGAYYGLNSHMYREEIDATKEAVSGAVSGLGNGVVNTAGAVGNGVGYAAGAVGNGIYNAGNAAYDAASRAYNWMWG